MIFGLTLVLFNLLPNSLKMLEILPSSFNLSFHQKLLLNLILSLSSVLVYFLILKIYENKIKFTVKPTKLKLYLLSFLLIFSV